ncbi:sensor histidine kinase (plasmid) [Paracoccus sp. TK19116]|uniref:histidine kinase n=1 Tax=Paracoccus albicereus TaxID=2922394 RepID=A0ABT1MML3_9RHOB|nr:sensor histidine kinase [Paracoccus albicereus]MCQ0969339.1 sensor histidine kinase [Paracoccus albicereus]
MLRGLRENLDFSKTLGFRLGMLLSIAILPLGLISVVQTMHLSREAAANAEIALIGRTASAASGERALLQGALGTADALSPAVLESMSNPAACSEMMRGFIERSATYVYAGFTPLSGLSTCHSGEPGKTVDTREEPVYRKFMAEPGTMVLSVDRGIVSGQEVVVVVHPVFRNRDLLGFMGVSLSADLLRSTHIMTYGSEQARIVTFNHKGEILTADRDGETPQSILPRDMALTDVLALGETTFRDMSVGGEERVFSTTTVVPGLVYALGSWNPRSTGVGFLAFSRFAGMLLPLALWAVSLSVAYFAVYRLVLRHIRVLRGQMRRFAIGNRDAPPPILHDAPAEIADVSQTFHNMARILIRDEEAMEEAVTEKTVLLKEVHHRVKNNLQLIASIINMQSRVIEHEDAKRVLRSVQDRVSALATIYRNLYQAEHLDAVEADRLIGDIINHMVNASVDAGAKLRVNTDLSHLTLLPDQAVPLSLMATEAFTNALKYAGVPPGEDSAWINVTLRKCSATEAEFEIENSIGERPEDGDSTGLGGQLIEAFAMQLEGEAETGTRDQTYYLKMVFRIERISPDEVTDIRGVVLTSAARQGSRH